MPMRRLLRHPVLSMKELAAVAGMSERRAYEVVEGKRPWHRFLPAVLPVIARADRELAVTIASAHLNLGAAGLEVRPAAPVEMHAAESPTTDLLQAQAHGGEAARLLLEAGEEIDANEAHAALPHFRRARLEFAEAEAKLEAIAARSPQLALRSVA